MKRIMLILTSLIGILLIINCCSDDNQILSVYNNGKELHEGASVPFSLYNNTPNPFQSLTDIRFQVNTSMLLTLTVYTEDWYKVKTLINMRLEAAIYVVNFDAEGMPNGDYYYTLEGGGYIQVRKMKLLK